jgi:ribosome maturation factor RimP
MDINQERTGLEKKFYLLCDTVVQEAGYSLYDLEYIPTQKLLRLYIQDPRTGSAVIEDCVKVDHALSAPFETEEWIPADITLEVSSPGVFRHLNRLEHFKNSMGEILSIVITGKLNEAQIAGAPKKILGLKKFRGKLISVDENSFGVEVLNYEMKFDYKQVKKVNLDPDLKSEKN